MGNLDRVPMSENPQGGLLSRVRFHALGSGHANEAGPMYSCAYVMHTRARSAIKGKIEKDMLKDYVFDGRIMQVK